MSEAFTRIPALARRLSDALERAHVPYAIGGALAYSEWGIPRSTKDLDINVFLGEQDWPRMLALLRSEGVTGDEDKALRQLRERGVCFLQESDVRVDVFVPSIPFYDSVKTRLVPRALLGRPAQFLSAEDISVFKMMFFRPRDIPDVQQMLATQGAALDRSYVRTWLVDMVGEQDERVTRWDLLCREVPPA